MKYHLNLKLFKFSTGHTIRIFNLFNICALVLSKHFCRLISSKAYYKVCFEVRKIRPPFFMSIPTIKY